MDKLGLVLCNRWQIEGWNELCVRLFMISKFKLQCTADTASFNHLMW